LNDISIVCRSNKKIILINRKSNSNYDIICIKQKVSTNGGGTYMEEREAFWKAIEKLVRDSNIVIDRPKGTAHPRFPDFIYKIDYGYLENTSSMDQGGIDVWVGTDSRKQIDAIMCIVDLMKRDSEIKILIGCTEEEKEIVYQTHNETEYMKGILIRR
jgi:inorganic pyrophosphatase